MLSRQSVHNMDLLGFGMSKLVTFLMVLARVGGIFTLAPVFGNQNVTRLARIAIAVSLTFVFVPMVNYSLTSFEIIPFLTVIFKEIMVGVLMGFLASMVFSAITMAGSYIDLAMGLGFSQQVDPMTKERTAVMGQLQTLVATLIFLAVNGHHIMIRGLADSFSVIPIGAMTFNPAAAKGMLFVFSAVIMAALKISAPVVGIIFITDVAMGIMGRTVPQMNIFNVGFALKLAVGLLVVIVVLPSTATIVTGLFMGLHRDFMVLLRNLI